ncbi:MAG: hypothetical protein IT561_13725, partial [Alphaproteobacteria bacterium]|nr:hypothetical protein [Alphaproteobacteria bacterium]
RRDPFPKPQCRAAPAPDDPCLLGKLNQALAIFHLGDDATAGNALVEETLAGIARLPGYLRDFHFMKATLFFRLVRQFGAHGTVGPGTMRSELERAVVDLFAQWADPACRIADADPRATWRIWESENHGAQRDDACWAAAMLLDASPAHQGEIYRDGTNVAAQRRAWTAYLRAYLRERGRHGLLVEMFSPSYSAYTLSNFHNYLDFSDDADLRRLARAALDLWWALWAQEQVGGVHGGAKARSYERLTAEGTPLDGLGWLYFAIGLRSGRGQAPGVAAMVTSGYQPPPVVVDLAVDVAGRGAYEVLARTPGRQRRPPAGGWYDVDPEAGGQLRVAYATPSFVMGTTMVERRPAADWAAIATQNRWSGVVLAGDPRARIVVVAEARGAPSSYSATWGVQSRAAQMLQAMPPPYSRNAGRLRVWFAPALRRVERGGWIFVDAGAWVAVRPASGGRRWEGEGWMLPDQADAPIVIQAAAKADYATLQAFQDAVLAASLSGDGGRVAFRGLGGAGRIALPAMPARLPEIGGKPVDLDPPFVLKSPFVNQARGSPVVLVTKDGRRLTLDFR